MIPRKCLYCEANLDLDEPCDCPESQEVKRKAAPEQEPPRAAREKDGCHYCMTPK